MGDVRGDEPFDQLDVGSAPELSYDVGLEDSHLGEVSVADRHDRAAGDVQPGASRPQAEPFAGMRGCVVVDEGDAVVADHLDEELALVVGEGGEE